MAPATCPATPCEALEAGRRWYARRRRACRRQTARRSCAPAPAVSRDPARIDDARVPRPAARAVAAVPVEALDRRGSARRVTTARRWPTSRRRGRAARRPAAPARSARRRRGDRVSWARSCQRGRRPERPHGGAGVLASGSRRCRGAVRPRRAPSRRSPRPAQARLHELAAGRRAQQDLPARRGRSRRPCRQSAATARRAIVIPGVVVHAAADLGARSRWSRARSFERAFGPFASRTAPVAPPPTRRCSRRSTPTSRTVDDAVRAGTRARARGLGRVTATHPRMARSTYAADRGNVPAARAQLGRCARLRRPSPAARAMRHARPIDRVPGGAPDAARLEGSSRGARSV